MADSRPPAIFLMGPTASGKTDLALALYRELPVDIISVDATQVYRGLDIGSAKLPSAVLDKVPHRLVDIRDPSEPYSAAEFARDAGQAMVEITTAGRIPLLVGGSMLYFRVLLEGLADMPPADPDVRDAIEQEAEQYGWPSLHEQLQKVDPELAASIHPNHSRRIQRALEIIHTTGKSPTQLRQEQRQSGEPPVASGYQVMQFAIAPEERRVLHQRIETRFRQMLEQGLLDEVKSLYSRGDLSSALPAIQAAGYRQLWQFLDGALSWEEACDKAVSATRQLAKRQLTWLRNWPDLHWLSIKTEAVEKTGAEAVDRPPEEQLCAQCLKIRLENIEDYAHIHSKGPIV